MTDKEMIIDLCEHLGLVRSDGPSHERYFSDRYIVLDREVILGSGAGYSGFWVSFEFDEHGGATKHSVGE